MNKKFTPINSLVKYIGIKLGDNLKFENKNLGRQAEVNHEMFSIFREIYLLTDSNMRKEGRVVFQVVFHASKVKTDTIIKRTDFTIPFFVGLPGFCNKQFMMNREKKTFSGKYEWEPAEHARSYTHSFAVRFMTRRSKPFPLSYRIIDKRSGNIIEERILT